MNHDLLATQLEGIVGVSHVLADPDLRAGYESDWTGRFRGEASFVVRPSSAEEVVALVHLARRDGVPLVPQGGNTGLVGGGVPQDGSVLVSMERMTDVEVADESAGTIRAQAGVTLERVDESAVRANSFWPISHAGGGRATVGGSIASNAGGSLAWRFGTTRHHVRGVEAVLGDGRLVSRLDALVKDNAGYDLTGLLCGSEGTLGIVTRATLALSPRPPSVLTALIAMDAPGMLASFAADCRRTPGMWMAEVIFAAAMNNVCLRLGLHEPFGEPAHAYVVLRCAGDDAATSLAALAGDRRSVQDERVWDLRERQNEAVRAAGVPVKLDVSLPIDRLEAFAMALAERASDVGVDAFVFGHLLDGNLHVNLVGEGATGLEEKVVRMVVDHCGAIAAEHGIGRAKTKWLSLARSADEISAMRAIKKALDPDGILNPGVLFG